MRTFELRGKKSAMFWKVELQGDLIVTLEGEAGTAGTRENIGAKDPAQAKKKYDRLIKQKLAAGYVETTPVPPPVPPMQQALEEALVEGPDDLAAHMAYADYLSDQADRASQARGEFVRVQLALEDERKSAAERKRLRQREKALLAQHGRGWLGEDLAVFLLDGRADDLSEAWWEVSGPRAEFAFARGWLDHLKIDYLTEDYGFTLAHASSARLLRRLTIQSVWWQGRPYLWLNQSPYLGNVRVLEVQGSYGIDADEFATHLPRLEELELTASHSDPDAVFRCHTLKHLRKLTAEAFTECDIEALAANPAMANLTHLSLHPHAMDEEERTAYIRLKDVRALVRSRHLKSLTHLTLRLSDAGDAGCREVVASGVLKRLKELDLGPGCVTDEGARLLAACPDLRHLQRLDLSRNRLTKAGAQALKQTGVEVTAKDQQRPGDDGEYDDSYLYEGDCE
jgi:uncharacterized protein (TIGR02996 family)